MTKTIRGWLLAWAACPAVALAHGGGLDASGCHTNRKTGDYHCHRAAQPALGPAQGRATPDASRSEAGRSGSRAPQAQPGQPTCHIGPRGGTYTLTPSGRKNYKGC